MSNLLSSLSPILMMGLQALTQLTSKTGSNDLEKELSLLESDISQLVSMVIDLHGRTTTPPSSGSVPAPPLSR